jgi:hypothetical protein
MMNATLRKARLVSKKWTTASLTAGTPKALWKMGFWELKGLKSEQINSSSIIN